MYTTGRPRNQKYKENELYTPGALRSLFKGENRGRRKEVESFYMNFIVLKFLLVCITRDPFQPWEKEKHQTTI